MYKITKGKLEVKASEEPIEKTPQTLENGIYVASLNKPRDRIILVHDNKILAVLNEINNNEINVQSISAGFGIYSNYRRVKTFNLEVTL